MNSGAEHRALQKCIWAGAGKMARDSVGLGQDLPEYPNRICGVLHSQAAPSGTRSSLSGPCTQPRRSAPGIPQKFFLGAPPSLISSQEFSPPARSPGLPSGPLYPAVISLPEGTTRAGGQNLFTESETPRTQRTLMSSCPKPCNQLRKSLAEQPNKDCPGRRVRIPHTSALSTDRTPATDTPETFPLTRTS
jgi:hypothetical protein